MTFFYNRRPSKAAKMTDLQLLTYLFELLDMETGEARTAAHTALNRYNDLSTILSLPRETLLQDPNLSEDCRSFLALIGAMVHRYAHRFRRSDLVVADEETVLRLIRPCLENSKKERVCAICVDEELHLLGSGAVTAHGTEDSAALPIQRLLALALASEAKGMILAHSHPDGTADFSSADLATTQALCARLSVLGVSLLDHYVWAGGKAVSLSALLRAPCPPPLLASWDTSSAPLLRPLKHKKPPVP